MTITKQHVGRIRLCVSLAVAFVLFYLSLLAPGAALAEQRGHNSVPREFGAGQLKEPDGVAVNEATGVVYVADSGDNRVELFNGTTGVSLGEINGSGTLVKRGASGAELEAEGTPAGAGGQPDEEVTGAFSDPTLVAVDNSCAVQRLTGAACEKADPSNGDVYVLDSGHKVVDKYTASGKYVGQITAKTLGVKGLVGLEGVAVEGDGDVLVSIRTLAEETEGVYRLSDGVENVVLGVGAPAGFTFSGKGGFVTPGLAGAGGRVFVAQGGFGSPDVTVYGLAGELLAGGFIEINGVTTKVPPFYAGIPGGLGGESCTGDVYVDTGMVVERFEGSHIEGSGGLVESLPVPGGVAASGSSHDGVAPDCASLGLFVVNTVTGVVDVYEKSPPLAPEVVGGSGFASKVTDDGARLSARVNPRSNPGEPETRYVFEYGPCPLGGECGAEFPLRVGGSVPAEYARVGVSVSVGGLVAGTRYRYRVSAYNAQEGGRVQYGEELFFTTQSSFPGGLLDGRGWELVTPPDKFGAEIEPVSENSVIQAAANGDAIAYLASAPTEEDPAGNTNKTQVLSRRGEDGWTSCDIGSPNVQATGVSVGVGDEYRAFSSDLEAGLAWPFGVMMPGLVAGEREVSPLLVGLSGECGGQPSYRPLLASCPMVGECERGVAEDADLEAGTDVADEAECRKSPADTPVFCAAEPLGANASLSAEVLRSKTVLSEGAPIGALYEWDSGHVYPVSVNANGSVLGGIVGNVPLLGTNNNAGSSFRGAVSEDGSRVVWSEAEGGHHLYVWDREAGKSVRVDGVQGGSGAGGVDPVFQFATADGGRVFFTDRQALTKGAGTSGADLYECEVEVEGEGEDATPKCALRDLTPRTEAGESAGVLGQAIGYSTDAGTIYFVANGVLSINEDASGERAVKGNCTGEYVSGAECNLYAWHEGAIELVAVLSGEDVGAWGQGTAHVAYLTGRVTGNGEWVAFMSDRSLTGYDNTDVHSGKPDEEVYLYNARGKSLVCVSCNPTGERPDGAEYGQLNHGVAGGASIWPNNAWLAANVPAWTPFRLEQAAYQPRYLDETGRMFFDSGDGLLPRDTNGTEDVYEYEPVDVGSCTTKSPGYLVADKGCLGLVSSGESGEESGFLDASESGNDVFFLTKSQLSKRDTDTSYDIYDARVGGTEPQESKPVECQGDACQSPVSPPESLTPSSATFSGPGNILTPPAPGGKPVVKKAPVKCAKGKVRDKHNKCVRKPKPERRHRTKR